MFLAVVQYLNDHPAAWGAIGTVVGALITAGNAYYWNRKARMLAATAAGMQVAVSLKRWLIQSEGRIRYIVDGGDHNGPLVDGDIEYFVPPLTLTEVSAQVALLSHQLQTRLFSAVDDVLTANSSIGVTLDLNLGPPVVDEALQEHRDLAVPVFLNVLSMYNELCKSVGWTGVPWYKKLFYSPPVWKNPFGERTNEYMNRQIKQSKERSSAR
jgi:hypothetical protein